MVRIGVHIDQPGPLEQETARGADAVQFFLGDPQGWKAPVIPGDPDEIRAAFAAAGVDAYIHASYVVNVATTNNRIRIPSRKILTQQLEAAASIGAKGLIVHGGHVTNGVDPAEGFANWQKAMERIERPIPLLIENTAGGTNAMARTLDAIGRLWDAVTAGIAGGEGDGQVGFCLDTCHANSAGLDLADVVDKIKAITGRVSVVTGNTARAPCGSSRDRHATLTDGTIAPELILGVVRAAGAPAVCETPDTDGSLAGDVHWLREHLAGG